MKLECCIAISHAKYDKPPIHSMNSDEKILAIVVYGNIQFTIFSH